jgi:PBSX family phage terminase large subunit
MEINLASLVAPSFHELINPILDAKFSKIRLTGGRGSTKSSFASLILVYGIMEDYHMRGIKTHAICLRKVANTLKDSVYPKIKWAINALGVTSDWKCTKSPMACTYLPSGQTIMFAGCDDPMKIKSITVEEGYIKYRWYEEYNQFSGEEEIRSLDQSLARGGKTLGIISYNPPPNLNNWANKENVSLEYDNDILKHHSSYLDVDPEWLGPDFINEAEKLKKKNKKAYDNEYLGLVTGIGGEIFNNIVDITLTDEEILQFERIRQGLDFGFTIDPSVFIKLCYQKNRNSITPFDEWFGHNVSTRELSKIVNQRCNKYEIIKADSAEQRTIDTMETEYNVNIIGCEKGPDSVRHGMKWLIDLDEIRIDRKRTPNTYREFTTYEYEKNKQGEFIKKYPDKDNHSIDASRYSLDDIILASGWRVPK